MQRLGWVWITGMGACVVDAGEIDTDGRASESSSTSDTSTTGGTDTDPTGGAGNCVEHPSVLASADEIGITGMSATQLLAEVEGTYTGSLWWIGEGPVRYLGAIEPTPLTLNLTYEGGEIRSIDAELVEPCMHDGPCPCEDSLEIDVRWELTTENGVLAESWIAPVIHQPMSWFMANAIGINHDFQPDETSGTLSAASFELEEGAVLNRLVAQSELGSGAAQGSINAEVEWMEWFGYGAIANFAAVRATDDAACGALNGEQACTGAGCSTATGQRVYGVAPACDCSPAESFCFAEPPVGGDTLTLYTRVTSDAYESWDEVVALPALADPPPPPWRACDDAPEIDACACFAGATPCT